MLYMSVMYIYIYIYICMYVCMYMYMYMYMVGAYKRDLYFYGHAAGWQGFPHIPYSELSINLCDLYN